ncbi:hypothetical protein FBR05_08035 [Deltaproteobacteria bacterium PRO3]|nr:hypothetical protein [Deltaproteobacteria bacterium PRO3]
MTPPNSKANPAPVDPLQLSLGLFPPAPPLVQKESPSPVRGRVEMRADGSTSVMVEFDLSLLLGGGAASRAARGLAKGAARHAASKAASGLAQGASAAPSAAPGTPTTTLKGLMDRFSDGIARGLETLFGPPPAWLVDLFDVF